MQNFISKPNVARLNTSVDISGRKKITSKEYDDLVSMQQAWDEIQAIRAQVEAEANTIRAQYREEGLRLGRADAQKEALEQVAQMQHSMNNWVKTTDVQLIELVNRCVSEVVHQIDPTLIAKQAIEKGLSELINAPQVNVRVHEITPDIEETVETMVKKYGISGNVRIITDGTLAKGDVIVDSPMGMVDLRLEKQLGAIEKVLKP